MSKKSTGKLLQGLLVFHGLTSNIAKINIRVHETVYLSYPSDLIYIGTPLKVHKITLFYKKSINYYIYQPDI